MLVENGFFATGPPRLGRYLPKLIYRVIRLTHLCYQLELIILELVFYNIMSKFFYHLRNIFINQHLFQNQFNKNFVVVFIK